MKNLYLMVTFISLVLYACGGEEAPSETADASIDTLTVSITDTIGVMMGDSSLVFGKITDATHTQDGRIYILDGIQSRISVFSSAGELLDEVGRNGSGPGEYQYPRSFALLENGKLVVCDWGGIAVTYLEPDLQFDTLITGYTHIAPDRITPGTDDSYVGMTLTHSVEDGEPVGDTHIARFGRDTEPELVYGSYPMRFSVDQDGDLNVHTVALNWDTGPDGSVVVAPSNDSTWSFTKYSLEGDSLFTVSRDWERVPKSQEEIEEGIVHETLSTSRESGNSVNRDRLIENIPRYRNAVTAVEVDDMGRIWIGQGWTDMPVFEVYDETGQELLFVAEIPELEGTRRLAYCFDNGFLAYDEEPVDYPKVYLLNVER